MPRESPFHLLFNIGFTATVYAWGGHQNMWHDVSLSENVWGGHRTGGTGELEVSRVDLTSRGGSRTLLALASFRCRSWLWVVAPAGRQPCQGPDGEEAGLHAGVGCGPQLHRASKGSFYCSLQLYDSISSYGKLSSYNPDTSWWKACVIKNKFSCLLVVGKVEKKRCGFRPCLNFFIWI